MQQQMHSGGMHQQQNRPGYIPVPPPSFALPPPNLNTPRMILPQHQRHDMSQQGQYHLPPPHIQQQQYPHRMSTNGQSQHMHQPPPNYMNMMPPNVSYHQNPNQMNPYMSQQYQQHQGNMSMQQQQGMLSMANMHGRGSDQMMRGGKNMYDDQYGQEIDNLNVNDDAAYDLDDELLDDFKSDHVIKSNDYDCQYDLEIDNIHELIDSSSIGMGKKHRSRHRHHHHRNDSDEEFRSKRPSKSTSRSKKKQSRTKNRSSKSKRKHSSDSNISDEDDDGKCYNEFFFLLFGSLIDQCSLTYLFTVLALFAKKHILKLHTFSNSIISRH